MVNNYIFVNGKMHRISGFILRTDLDRVALENNILQYTVKSVIEGKEISMEDLPYDGDVTLIEHEESKNSKTKAKIIEMKKNPVPSIQDIQDRIDRLDSYIEATCVLVAVNIVLTAIILFGGIW